MAKPKPLQVSKKGPWWVVEGPWQHLLNVIEYWKYQKAGVNLGVIKVGNERNTENACFFIRGDRVFVGIVSFFGNPKGRNALVSSAKKIAEALQRLIRKSVDKRQSIAISQLIMKALQKAEAENDSKAVQVLKDFSLMLVSNRFGKKIPSSNLFMSSASETTRFAEYVNRQEPRVLTLAKTVDSWINGGKIKKFKRSHLERCFRKYGKATGLIAIGKPFRDPTEYLTEAMNLIYNPKSKKMMYYYRGKKPSLGCFLKKEGKLLWTAVSKNRIVTFRPVEAAIADSEVFNKLYRVC